MSAFVGALSDKEIANNQAESKQLNAQLHAKFDELSQVSKKLYFILFVFFNVANLYINGIGDFSEFYKDVGNLASLRYFLNLAIKFVY